MFSCNESRGIGYTLLSSGCEYQQLSQFNFALCRLFWYIFPHRQGCFAFSEQIVYSQNKIIISQQQPSIGPNWMHFKLVRSVFFAVVVRLECSTQNMHQITRANTFSHFIFSSKIKRQKDTISPQSSLLCACPRCHMKHSSGRRTTAVAVGSDDIPTDHFYHQKMLSIFICTFSQYTFAYYINFSTFVI
jgi:hypothetical protein